MGSSECLLYESDRFLTMHSPKELWQGFNSYTISVQIPPFPAFEPIFADFDFIYDCTVGGFRIWCPLVTESARPKDVQEALERNVSNKRPARLCCVQQDVHSSVNTENRCGSLFCSRYQISAFPKIAFKYKSVPPPTQMPNALFQQKPSVYLTSLPKKSHKQKNINVNNSISFNGKIMLHNILGI